MSLYLRTFAVLALVLIVCSAVSYGSSEPGSTSKAENLQLDIQPNDKDINGLLDKALHTKIEVKSKNWKSDRDKVMQLLVAIVRSTQAKMEPSFDPAKDERVLKVSVPGSRVNPQYPPGIEPEKIKDPGPRSQYEVAIAENARKEAAINLQFDLRKYHHEAILGIRNYLRLYYSRDETIMLMDELLRRIGQDSCDKIFKDIKS